MFSNALMMILSSFNIIAPSFPLQSYMLSNSLMIGSLMLVFFVMYLSFNQIYEKGFHSYVALIKMWDGFKIKKPPE